MEPQSSSNDDPPDIKPRTGKAQRPATGWSRSRCCRRLRPRRAAAWLGAQRRGRQPHSHVVDTVRAARTGTLDADQLAAGLAAVVAAVALTQLAAARRFAGLIHRD
jgi:hypothetical protein